MTPQLFSLCLPVLLLTSPVAGQEPGPPAPGPPPDERSGPKHPPRLEKGEEEMYHKPRPNNGERPSHGNRSDMNFSKLSKEERERVRIAMGKAWNNAEVQAARNKLQAATREYREALRLVLEKEDPGISALMEKGRLPEFPPEGIPPYAEGFVRELFQKLDENERKEIPAVTREVFKNPEVTKALEAINAAKEEDRQASTRNLRKTLRQILARAKPEWEKRLRDEEEKQP